MTRYTRVVASLVLSLCIGACASLGSRTADFQFFVSGVVQDHVGLPLEGVVVQLNLQGTAFAGTTPVREAREKTDAKGSFSFAYIIHERQQAFELSFQKEGYAERTVSGSSPPAARLAITLTPNR